MNQSTFFYQGFSVSTLDKPEADFLLNEVQRLPFTYESGKYGTDGLSSSAFPEDGANPQTCLRVSDNIREFWRKRTQRVNFFKGMGDFSFQNCIAHTYSTGESMNWHYDLFDRTALLNILYLTTDKFTESDGGYLTIGRCNVDQNGKPLPDTVQPVEVVLPNHGTLVTINNFDPTVVHSVAKLHCQKLRLTLSCQMGYLEHTWKNSI